MRQNKLMIMQELDDSYKGVELLPAEPTEMDFSQALGIIEMEEDRKRRELVKGLKLDCRKGCQYEECLLAKGKECGYIGLKINKNSEVERVPGYIFGMRIEGGQN